jgi:hypothetical protein
MMPWNKRMSMMMRGQHVFPVVRVAIWHNPMYTWRPGAGQLMCDRFRPGEVLGIAGLSVI